MGNFGTVKEALEYIDRHLDEEITFELLAGRFGFSAYYFHKLFTIIVGKPIAAYVRERRLLHAAVLLTSTDLSVLNIALNCGFNSAQAFCRSFKEANGMPPSKYRGQGLIPQIEAVDEMIMRFTNRIKGGVYLNPKIITRGKLIIAGASGDGDKTAEVWSEFETLNAQKPIPNALSGNGYEIRLYDQGTCTVHVGFAVPNADADPVYKVIVLPPSKYASFDVYVANGYASENNAINQWLETNREGYTEKTLDGVHYCVEYYDERFNGSEAGSIVEIWIPVEKRDGGGV